MRRLRDRVRFALVLTLLLGVALAGCRKSAPPQPSVPTKSTSRAQPATPKQPAAPAAGPAETASPTPPAMEPAAAAAQPAAPMPLPTTEPAVAPALPPAPLAGPAQPATTEPAAAPTLPPAPTPPPTTEPPVPVAVPAQPGAATEPLKPADNIRIDFKDAKLDDVLTYLANAAGYIVIKEIGVAADTRVTVIGLKDLNADQAVELLNSVLKDKGYAVWKSQLDGQRILHVTTLGDIGKRPIPVYNLNDYLLIPISDEQITNVIALRYTDAVRLKQDLAPLISESAKLVSNAATNSLIISDTSANVRRIVEIVHALDTRVTGVAAVKVFQLKFADATSTATLITNLFKPPSSTPQTGFGGGGRGAFNRFMMAQNAATAAAATTATGDQAWQPPTVTAAADARTNSLVVTGPPETLVIIEGIVKSLDSNTAEDQAVFVYPLQNAVAANLQTQLNNLFGTATGTGASATRAGGAGGFGGRGSGASALPTPGAGLLGQVYVVANTDTNSLMVMTLPKYFEQVKAIIRGLDIPVRQVLIKVLIAQVTHSDTMNLGAEFSDLNLRMFGKNGQTLSTAFPNMPTSGLLMGVANSDFKATLAALETVGKVDVLSDPYILGSDNQLATILVGFQVPFITNSRTDVNSNVINTIQYQDLGISLKVTPHINPGGLVTMDLTPEIDTLDTTFGQQIFIAPGVPAAVFDKTTTTSRVAIRDGQTIVIGGLMQDQKTDTISKVPLLGDIPLIGALFRSTLTIKQKQELIIFITPNVATQQEALKAISDNEERHTTLVPNAVGPGVFDGYRKNVQRKEAPLTTNEPAPTTIEAAPATKESASPSK